MFDRNYGGWRGGSKQLPEVLSPSPQVPTETSLLNNLANHVFWYQSDEIGGKAFRNLQREQLIAYQQRVKTLSSQDLTVDLWWARISRPDGLGWRLNLSGLNCTYP